MFFLYSRDPTIYFLLLNCCLVSPARGRRLWGTWRSEQPVKWGVFLREAVRCTADMLGQGVHSLTWGYEFVRFGRERCAMHPKIPEEDTKVQNAKSLNPYLARYITLNDTWYTDVPRRTIGRKAPKV